MNKKQLGKVTDSSIQIEDHGILTLYVLLDFGGSCQAFGNVALDAYDKEEDRRVGTAAGMDLILRLLRLFDVRSLPKIVGRPVYALRDNDAWGGTIQGLETPEFDGSRKLLLDEWRKDWGYPVKVKNAEA